MKCIILDSILNEKGRKERETEGGREGERIQLKGPYVLGLLRKFEYRMYIT